MTKITTWLGTVRKAWALAVSATSLWASALLTDGQPGVSGKAWAALIAIWTNVVIVYLVGNETPGTTLVQGVVREFDAPTIVPRVLAPGEMLAEGQHSGSATLEGRGGQGVGR